MSNLNINLKDFGYGEEKVSLIVFNSSEENGYEEQLESLVFGYDKESNNLYRFIFSDDVIFPDANDIDIATIEDLELVDVDYFVEKAEWLSLKGYNYKTVAEGAGDDKVLKILGIEDEFDEGVYSILSSECDVKYSNEIEGYVVVFGLEKDNKKYIIEHNFDGINIYEYDTDDDIEDVALNFMLSLDFDEENAEELQFYGIKASDNGVIGTINYKNLDCDNVRVYKENVFSCGHINPNPDRFVADFDKGYEALAWVAAWHQEYCEPYYRLLHGEVSAPRFYIVG